MALNLDGKKAVVEEVAQFAQKAHSAVAAEYRGLTVTELTELRKTARETGVYLRVVKNTLAKRAVAGTEFECMQNGLVGMYAKWTSRPVIDCIFDGRSWFCRTFDQ